MSRLFVLFTFVLVVLSSGYQVPSVAGPSFSCDKPNTVEKVICESEDLSAKDQLLAHFFSLAKQGALGNGVSNVVQDQRKWVVERNKMCGKPLDPQCISSAYDTRLFELAVSDLFADHDTAIGEIARQHPKLGSIYEAMYTFATVPDVETRTRLVAPLIADAYSANEVVPGYDLGGVHVAAQPQQLFNGIPDAQVAASSADALGTVFWLVSAYGYGDLVFPLRIPCGAIIRRPDAVLWLIPRWGGAIDGRTPDSDCLESMPPLPAYAALADKAQNKEIGEGTIRFSLGAITSADYSAVMTHSLGVLLKRQDRREHVSGAMKSFSEKNSALIEAAVDELGDYYQKNFGATPDDAGRDARTAVSTMLENLLNGNE